MHYPKNNVQKYYLVWCVINLSKPNCTTKWESNISDNNIWPTDLILPSCNYHMDHLMLTTSNDPIWPDVDPCNDPIWPDVDPHYVPGPVPWVPWCPPAGWSGLWPGAVWLWGRSRWSTGSQWYPGVLCIFSMTEG